MIVRFLLVVVALWAAVSLVLFVFHRGDAPRRADAVFVLSGADERLPVGLRLVRDGYAPLLVVSRSHDPKALERSVCAGHAGVHALCRAADPYSTQGEARLLAGLARARRWDYVDVVTSRFHVFRAKILIRRCYRGGLRVVAAPNPPFTWFVRDVALESVKLVYHEVRRGC